MTLIECASCHNEEQIQKLQMYLTENYQGQLDEKRGPVDSVIKILEGFHE